MWNFFEKLKKGLSKTHQGFVEKIDQLFLGKKTIDQELLDELEGVLFEADLGVKTSGQLIEGVRQGLKRGDLEEPEKVKEFIKQEIFENPEIRRETALHRLLPDKTIRHDGGWSQWRRQNDHHRENCPSVFIAGEKGPGRRCGYLQGGCG